jgi:small subunit ribosomal protein S18
MGPSTKVARQIDPFHIRQSNPLDHTLNPLMTFRFVNAFGKIRPRSETGLTWRSQRMVGKMVRRARAMGIVSRWTNLPRPGGLGEQDFNQR